MRNLAASSAACDRRDDAPFFSIYKLCAYSPGLAIHARRRGLQRSAQQIEHRFPLRRGGDTGFKTGLMHHVGNRR